MKKHVSFSAPWLYSQIMSLVFLVISLLLVTTGVIDCYHGNAGLGPELMLRVLGI